MHNLGVVLEMRGVRKSHFTVRERAFNWGVFGMVLKVLHVEMLLQVTATMERLETHRFR